MTEPIAITATDHPTCPICDEKLTADWAGQLYGIRVCESCRRAFARRRYWAFIFDVLVLFVIIEALQFVVWLVDKPSLDRVFKFAAAILELAFLLRDGFNGQSPGKQLFDLQATRVATGAPAGLSAGLLRNLPILLPPITLYIFAELKFGPRIGDGLAKTKVIWKHYRDKAPFRPPGSNCHQCGYDLTGNTSGQCPECGTTTIGAAPLADLAADEAREGRRVA
ncbi:MAG TPA: RDD family protein [Phycisphaerae bacterium]|nr:RDD family protein [Phycisphaerae bacterium]HRW52918.1 RDD family protein [Phycisphaerae bacterium]